MPARKETLEIAGREVSVSNPDKVFFPSLGVTKLDLVRYYAAVADGALRGVGGRPMALKRYVDGAEGEFFFQKRAPTSRPAWIETVELRFPSGRTAHEIVVRDVPVDAFWSISVYDADGYYRASEAGVYSLNNVTAEHDASGAVTIRFGGADGSARNRLPITPGWNYTVRLYRPRQELLDGTWHFPEAEPIPGPDVVLPP